MLELTFSRNFTNYLYEDLFFSMMLATRGAIRICRLLHMRHIDLEATTNRLITFCSRGPSHDVYMFRLVEAPVSQLFWETRQAPLCDCDKAIKRHGSPLAYAVAGASIHPSCSRPAPVCSCDTTSNNITVKLPPTLRPCNKEPSLAE